MKTALITGSSGFIGTHMALTMETAGYRVYRLDLVDPDDPHDCCDVFRYNAQTFDAVIHCAAVVGGRKVIDWTPLEHARNLAIDAALFQWAERVKPGRVVYFSSSCAYSELLSAIGGRHREYEIDMYYPMWPDGLYGWTKLTGEILARTVRSEGIPVSIVRPFSVYGPGVRPGFAMFGIGAQVRERTDPIEIWGDADQVRDYIHVTDVCNAVLTMIKDDIDGPVNLGTGRETSLRDLALMMAAHVGYEPEITVNAKLPSGVPYLVADTRYLNSFYQPQITLEQGIAEIL